MLAMSSYLRLMRLHQPVGIWLLLWPCWWSLALASPGFPSLRLLILFALGAVVMRSAGCIINDMVDREIDRQVERTKTRPLASGALSMFQASLLLAVLLFIALIIALLLGKTVLLWSAAALLPVALYPWMKRITWWPQLFLGLTFNWGALVGWVAVRGEIEAPALWLYTACVCWTLGYDTIYAHQDKIDDEAIGVKSTARLWGARTKPFLAVCYAVFIMLFCISLLQTTATLPLAAWACIAMAVLHLFWQIYAVKLDQGASCKKIFKSNITLGTLFFTATLLANKF